MRLAVYTDYAYHRRDGEVLAERAFALFLSRLAGKVERLVLIGRLHPDAAGGRYPVGDVSFAALPYYESLARPGDALRTLLDALRRFWRALDDVDAVWLLGPHPFILPFLVIAGLRRRRLALGVRQDFPSYVRRRHPRRRMVQAVALVLEALFRLLSRVLPVVAVGPDLGERYRRAPRLLETSVSLIEEGQLVDPQHAPAPRAENLQLLSVGRLDSEKNPLLLAEVLALLHMDGRPWHLTICGEGPLQDELAGRLEALGIAEHAQLAGYVPFGEPLMALYRQSRALLHVSWTEGLPQVLFEAFAAAIPVVATDVGGIRAAVGDAVLAIPPGDAAAAAAAIRRLVDDPALSERLRRRGARYAAAHTIEIETDRVARFLERPRAARARE